MQTIIFKSSSKSDLKLLTDLAKKIGVKTKILSESDVEEIGLSFAIKQGRTKNYIDTEKFINKLKK